MHVTRARDSCTSYASENTDYLTTTSLVLAWCCSYIDAQLAQKDRSFWRSLIGHILLVNKLFIEVDGFPKALTPPYSSPAVLSSSERLILRIYLSILLLHHKASPFLYIFISLWIFIYKDLKKSNRYHCLLLNGQLRIRTLSIKYGSRVSIYI